MAIAAVPDLEFLSLGERDHESNELIHREVRLRGHLPVELEHPTEPLCSLEQENAKLKKLVAERDLEIELMKEVAAKKMVSAPVRRRQVA